jgi:hypothetical protein
VDRADAALEQARRRYHAGARTLRTVRVYDPEGGVRLVDFAAEDRDAARALRAVERATAVWERAIRAATEEWRTVLARAIEAGHTIEDVAAAAGLTPRELRAVLRGPEREH